MLDSGRLGFGRIILWAALAGFASPLASAFEALPPAPKTKPAEVELGKALYFDKRLSKDDTVSCASCHQLNHGGVDGLQFSKGVGGAFGDRNPPTVLNAAFQSVQFWDGRAATLEEQAKGPLVNPVEMAMENHEAVVAKLKGIEGYQKAFKKVYDGEITIDRVAQAIAAFERTLVTPDSPFDRYLKGNKKALSAKQIAGMKAFETVGCTTCHSGASFSGPTMPAGSGFYMRFPLIAGSEYDTKYELTKDPGRFKHTKNEADRGMWRVPTLRNIALTAPYFHNGSVKALDEAVRVMAKTQLGKTLKESEVEELVEFLKALTGNQPQVKEPKFF